MKVVTHLWVKTPRALQLLALMLTLAAPRMAQAAQFTDAFTTLETQFNGFGIWVYALSLIIGVVLFVWALIKFAHSHKLKESKAVPVVMMLIGVCLMSLPFVVSMVASSTFGSDTTNVQGIISGSG